jgi:DNA-binding PadR family transcriptional regulator
MFEGGELRLVLLKMIADAPRHGYELIKAIEELTGGAYAPSPGLVYPSLTMLGEIGLIEEQASEGARKRFAATPEGIAHVAEKAAEIEAVMARLAALDHEGNRVAWNRLPIRRALGNLREAVRNRFEQGDLSDERLHDMAALIDGVAQQIERLK